ncbi:hypothetical protein C5748_01465 [Phyllobacterium phragmitis]|uniref:Uncharacterized protein n=1 Tax=Phyllobacterium phragmitis TaxID=2670329 RepID=A0A2S9IZ78_9HYPH|nr:hypothetical protein C5748_01465 [Phyllobacterium phragmitis]
MNAQFGPRSGHIAGAPSHFPQSIKAYPVKIRNTARKSLELPYFNGYLARTGEVAEWSKALPC